MINLHSQAIDLLLPQIGPDAFVLLLSIARHMDAKKTCFPSRHTLMRLTGLKKDSYYAAMKVLKDGGLLLSHQSPGKGGVFGKNIFKVKAPYIDVYVGPVDEFKSDAGTVSEIPEPCPATPDAATPDAATPDAVESDTISITSIEVLSSIEVLPVTTKEQKIVDDGGGDEDIFKSYADKLKDDTLSIERMALATKVFKPGEVPELLESFYLMLLANERAPHKNYSEFRSHFFNWIGRHKEKQPTEQQRKAQRETEQNDIERRRQLAREQKYGL